MMTSGVEVDGGPEKQGDLLHNKDSNPSHKDSISLEILQVIKDAQNQHGLKHGDYHRYRGYCSRRIRRIRKSLHFVQSTGSKNKSVYVQKKVNPQLIGEAPKNKKEIKIRYLYIPLMNSERCWAYAMALKQEANTEPRKKFHLHRRLKKAVMHAQELEDLCNQPLAKCDARTKLESQAYCAYITGLLHFEMEEWLKASEFLKKAQAIYVKLCNAIGDEDAAAPYQQRVDELKPTLRYCAFNIGEHDVGAQDFIDTLKHDSPAFEDDFIADKIDQLILQTREKQAVTLSEITWLGKSITVKVEKIRSFLLSIQELETGDPRKISQLEKLLFECRDCIQLLREAGQEKTALYCYLSYLRLHITCLRNLQLIKTLQNPSDLIRPYETIIGSLGEMKSLPLDQHFNYEHIETFLKELDARILVYKAFRCYFIGNFGKLSWKESVAMLHRATNYANLALTDENLDKKMKEDVEKLKAKTEGEKFTLYANSLMNDENEAKKTDNKLKQRPLIERLNEYDENPALASGSLPFVHFPPQFRPIPTKPLFFDLALNHIEFPSLESEIKNTKTSGITGLVKGWLGGRWK